VDIAGSHRRTSCASRRLAAAASIGLDRRAESRFAARKGAGNGVGFGGAFEIETLTS
jgi:hypothetical protein